MEKNNVILIGMPTSGKSTVGVILAKLMGMDFVDTDLLIQKREHRKLARIIEEDGLDGFLNIENSVCQEVNLENTVIATGGSVVYGNDAMKNLSKDSIVVYLKLDYNKLRYRLGNIKNRGVVIREKQSLCSLYKERVPLYEKYADVIIEENGCNIENTVSKIITEISISL